MPAVLVAVPFALLRPDVALSLFSALSTAILAFAVTRTSYARLPLFLSASFAHAAVMGQWSLLLTAALFAPMARLSRRGRSQTLAWRCSAARCHGAAAVAMLLVRRGEPCCDAVVAAGVARSTAEFSLPLLSASHAGRVPHAARAPALAAAGGSLAGSPGSGSAVAVRVRGASPVPDSENAVPDVRSGHRQRRCARRVRAGPWDRSEPVLLDQRYRGSRHDVSPGARLWFFGGLTRVSSRPGWSGRPRCSRGGFAVARRLPRREHAGENTGRIHRAPHGAACSRSRS